MENSWLTPETVQEQLNIEKSQYYARLKELGIKAHRHKGKAYLDPDQVQRLHDHINGQSSIATVSNNDLAIIENSSENMTDDEQDDLWREAAELKAQQMSIGDLVKIHLAAGMKFEDLPEDLQDQVRSINRAANPDIKKSASSIANQLLERYRSGKK